MIEVRKKDNESPSSLLYRFTKKVRQSGVLHETRKRRFKDRTQNRQKRRLAALHRETKKRETARKKKLGVL
jgi:ribosomal protein S21